MKKLTMMVRTIDRASGIQKKPERQKGLGLKALEPSRTRLGKGRRYRISDSLGPRNKVSGVTAIVGEGKGFGMYEVCELIGKDETLRRLDRALSQLSIDN